MKPMRFLILSCVLAGLAIGPLQAQGAVEYQKPEPNIFRGSAAQPLTLPANASPVATVARFLKEKGRNDATASSVVAVAQSQLKKGVSHARMEQRINGLLVYDGYVKAAFGARGELVHLIDGLANVPPGKIAKPSVDEKTALSSALRALYPAQNLNPGQVRLNGDTVIFARGTFFAEDPTVTAVAIPMTDGSLTGGYLVDTWSKRGNLLHETLVAGDGRVLSIELRTNNDRYNVFPVSPAVGGPTVVGPIGPTPQSPIGWLTGAQTTLDISGNNVRAYLDRNADNASDGGGSAVIGGDFLAAPNFAIQPTVAPNQAVAVQNLFYLNNYIHDRLYTYGFDEAAGNFQNQNFGSGPGRAGDAVNAEAQDGGDFDNADFATPRDGRAPRMQMYLWTGPDPTHAVVIGATTYGASGAAFGPALTPTGVTAPLAIAPVANACTAMTAGSLSGKVAVIDRGACEFETKAKNAQDAGAVATIIVNNQGGTVIFTMGAGTIPGLNVTIPSVMVSQNDGPAVKAAAGTPATVKLVDPPPLRLDASLDSDVVYHEYCHGLTWRMIGNMSGPMSGAIGEGMSDVCAILINNDDVVGEYSGSSPLGIRSAPYANYPRKYGDFSGAEVHFDGEIYAAIGWRLWEKFQGAGLSVEVLFSYLVDGMNYTPPGPAFEDMRDGILQSVANGNPAHSCLVWNAFAEFEVGVGAKGKVNGSGVKVTTSSAVPPECQP